MINSEQGRRVFALEVGGLQYRYHSGGGTTGLDTSIISGFDYIDIESIVEVGTISSSLDVAGGVGQYTGTSITLSVDRKRGGDGDPGVIFGRCGQRSATNRAQLTTSIDRSDIVMSVSKDLTNLSYPRLMHIGAETVRVLSATSTSLSLGAAVSRGLGNTPRQTHSISLEGSSVPEVTTEITTFRGRRAVLYAAHKYSDGSLSAWLQVVNGFIESSPIIEEQDKVSLTLMPLTALLDTDLGDKGIGQSSLLDGFHYFGTESNTLEYGIRQAFIYQYAVDLTSIITASTISLIKNDNTTLSLDYDVSLPRGSVDTDFNGQPHPRYPRLKPLFSPQDKYAFPIAINQGTNASGQTIYTCTLASQTESYTQTELRDITHLTVPRLVELKQHELGLSQLKKWPDVINETLDSDGPTSSTGLSGGLAKWVLNGDTEIIVNKTTRSNQGIEVYLWSNKLRFRLDVEGNWQNARYWRTANSALLALDDRSRVWYPMDLSTREEDFVQDIRGTFDGVFRNLRIRPPTTSARFSIRGVASAYYQIYEDRFLVESSLGLPASSSSSRFDIVVRFTDRKTNEQRDQVFVATHETLAIFDGLNVGFYIHLDPDQDFSQCVSFGNWKGFERVNIFRAARINGDRPGVALLKLLESGGGDQINGTYDVFTVGLNIDSTNIDEQSFLNVDTTAIITVDSFLTGDNSDVRRLVESICKLLSAAIVMKRNSSTGKNLITLVSIGNDRTANTDQTISAQDWLADPPPYWGIYEDIVTQIEYEYDYDAIQDKYMSSVIFNNQEAITRYSGERSKITLRLPGLSSDDFGRNAGDRFAEFLPISSRIFNLLSNPLRVWRGSISTGQSIYLDVGSYVQVTSPHLKGYSDEYGVVDGVGMIRSIRQELMNEGCELEIIVTGLSPVAWNVTAKVTAITTDSVTVLEDEFSDATVDDASFFKVADVVDYVPLGDHDNAITGLTIQSINGNDITFASAHGISTSDGTLESTSFNNASAVHKTNAYLANSSDLINNTTEAQEYS